MFTAQYAFRCGGCDEPCDAGTSAEYVDGVVFSSEDGCVGAQMSSDGSETIVARHRTMPHNRTAADRCDLCFMIHSQGQEDCE